MANEQTEDKILTRGDLLKSWWRWICWAQRCYNYERLMGLGFCQAISNVIEKLFPKEEDKKAALTRHIRFYNTENNWGAMILGITCALEEERAMGKKVETDVIDNMKSALMGPLAGIGDSVTQSIVRVILLGICIDLASQGNVLGPIFHVLLFSIYCLVVSYTMFFSGYRTGRNAITKLLSSETAKSITGALKIVSMMVVGALAAANIRVRTPIQGKFGGSEVVLQKVLDAILPRMLPLAVLILVLYLLKSRKMSTIAVLGLLFVIGFALSFLKILA
jgi:mannose/fructose/N-acetylgalactosamine-specific phosphotransferase system component IID